MVENTEDIHNVIVCTLCSCYPIALLGPSPTWYKSEAYRSRVVRDPRGVLREFGFEPGPDVKINVWDSSAESRYMVLPRRPAGTGGPRRAGADGVGHSQRPDRGRPRLNWGWRMFERFTDRARRVVVLAQEEARMLNHAHIGTEHLLLGLAHEGQGVAARALEALGISLEAVRREVEETIGRGEQPPSGHIPFTPRAKKVLELSLRELTQLGHQYIGTEHILLGLLREGRAWRLRCWSRWELT